MAVVAAVVDPPRVPAAKDADGAYSIASTWAHRRACCSTTVPEEAFERSVDFEGAAEVELASVGAEPCRRPPDGRHHADDDGVRCSVC